MVTKAALHNEEYCIDKDVRVGDVISIRKAGDVIPEVVEVKLDRRKDDSVPFKMIENCPMCNTLLIKKDANNFCPNKSCPSRKIESLIHFVSRDAMYIDGFGDRIIEDFYNMNYLNNIEDFYTLYKYKEELKTLEGFGEKSIDNLLTSIENSKNNSLERLLFGIGIRYVGKKTAKILAKYYKDMDNLVNATYEELISIPDIGDIIAKSVVDYFSNKSNLDFIQILKDLDINMKYNGVQIDDTNEKINGKTFVITGTLSRPRDEIKEELENKGANVTSSVTKKTDFVLAGEKAGSKYDKAISLGIKIINEEELNNMLREDI